jgi:outer membrane protein assembly factor BamB
VVIVAYTSGEIYALQVETGRVVWADSLAAVRRIDPLSDIAQVRGLPVIDRGLVFVVSHAGRTAAIDLRRGNRIWERDLGGTETPWAAGDFLYLVTNEAELVCLTREEGAVRWVTSLPRYLDPEDREDPITWYGPILASDRLIVAGSHGEAYAVSPYDGQIIGVIDLPSGAAVSPVLANSTLYFVSTDADIEALR